MDIDLRTVYAAAVAKGEASSRMVTFRVTPSQWDQLEQRRMVAGLSSVGDYCRTRSLVDTSPETVRAAAYVSNFISTTETALAEAKAILNPEGE